MRRICVLLLLALLPLQMALASVAPYCALAEAPGAAHFAEHDHLGTGPAGYDESGCVFCAHAAGVCAIGPVDVPVVFAGAAVSHRSPLLSLPAGHLSSPERPKWRSPSPNPRI